MKKYWKSTEELRNSNLQGQKGKLADPEFSIEGLTEEEVSNKFKTDRRSFLKALGFSVGYATIASSCQQPIQKAIPFLNKPEEITPGVANYYASTFFDGHDYASVLIKVREGRPIKIEGNELSSINGSGTSARTQASILGLYDGSRQQNPEKNGTRTSWEIADGEIIEKLEAIAAENGKIVLLSSSIISPSTRRIFDDFKQKYPTTNIVYYDSVSYSASLAANKNTFGIHAIPQYHFENADIILGFNADFLGTWLSPVEFASQYAKTRDLTSGKKSMSKHYQFESNMSVTGSNADKRFPIRPSDEKKILLNLYNAIALKSNRAKLPAPASPVDINQIAEELLSHKGKSLIVSGSNDQNIQTLVNVLNFMLGNIGSTLDFSRPAFLKQGDDLAFEKLVQEMDEEKVSAILMYNVNPVYDYSDSIKFISGLSKTALVVSLSQKEDETARHVHYLCPDNHYLESWNDAQPYKGLYSLGQPTIHPIFETRQAQESLLLWAGKPTDFHTYIQDYWKTELFPMQKKYQAFNDFWTHTLQNGVLELEVSSDHQTEFDFKYLEKVSASLSQTMDSQGIDLVLYEKVGIGNGLQANNPWLQELPDPISKVVWDNYINVSPRFAQDQGWEQEDLISVNGIKLPVFIQPGQAYGTISIALGYGRTNSGKIGNSIGKNVFMLAGILNGSRQYSVSNVTVNKTGETYPLATTQTHHSMEGREIVKETTLEEYIENPSAGNESHKIIMERSASMYKEHDFPGAHWGLSIDLNKCVGCNSCVIACQVENNVAVIGKEEVRNRRIMHWLRIDRYYSTVSDSVGAEVESDNPQVLHQPVMCLHCDNAPCENVCPVAATPHSKEGLNTMAYNRCIGTRYCMNNCPYRVRSFNWYRYIDNDQFDYNFNDKYSKMVLNPDVVVRERGVVEKCSFCVQRIQEKKLLAKNEGRELRDGEIQPACVQSCPTQALVFGDTNMKDSEVNSKHKDERAYGLLEELHTLPSLMYLTKVRNTEKDHSEEDGHHA